MRGGRGWATTVSLYSSYREVGFQEGQVNGTNDSESGLDLLDLAVRSIKSALVGRCDLSTLLLEQLERSSSLRYGFSTSRILALSCLRVPLDSTHWRTVLLHALPQYGQTMPSGAALESTDWRKVSKIDQVLSPRWKRFIALHVRSAAIL